MYLDLISSNSHTIMHQSFTMISKIQNLVASGKTLEALNQLIVELQKSDSSSNHLIDAINLKNQWSEISRKESLNLVSLDDSNIQKSRINNALLELIQTSSTPKNNADANTITSSKKPISRSILLTAFGIITVLGFSFFLLKNVMYSEDSSDISKKQNATITNSSNQTDATNNSNNLKSNKKLTSPATKEEIALMFKKDEAKNKIKSDKKHGKWIEYYDSNWKPVDKIEEAPYFRLIEFKNGIPIGITRDFFQSGELQWVGKLTDVNPDQIEGWANWYHKNGVLQKMAFYVNGKLENEMLEFYDDSKKYAVRKYKNNQEIFAAFFNKQNKLTYLESIDENEIKTVNQKGDFALVMFDDFSTDFGKWGILKNEHVVGKQENRKFTVETKNNTKAWHFFKERFYFIKETDDFLIEIKTNWFGGDTKMGYGITWGGKDVNTLHAFYINSQDEFSIFNIMKGQYSGKYEKTNKIQRNSLNKLGIKKVNNQYQFLINDELVKTMPFSDFYGSQIGVAVTGNQKVAFDDFAIYYFKK